MSREGGAGRDQATGPAVRFSVLGPVRAWWGDAEIDLGERPVRLVLALLLVRCGAPVRRDELVDLLWDADRPERPSALIADRVAELERLLPLGAVVHDRDTYRLPVDDSMLDLVAFRRAITRVAAEFASGRPGAAVAIFAAALGRWHGRCGAGLEPSTALHPAFVAVDRERSRAACMVADQALAAGVSGGLVSALAAAVELDPLDEDLQLRTMRVLAANEQVAEALDGYVTFRQHLADVLGQEPGREVAEQFAGLLTDADDRAEPMLAEPAPGTRPAQLPAGSRHFAGRGRELAELAGQWRSGEGREVVTIAVDGIPGVGKSALAVYWAHQVAEEFPDGQLFVNLRGFDEGEQVGVAEALTAFLTALGVPHGEIPTGVEAMAGLYRSVMWTRRMVVVLDNASGVEQVRALIPGSPGSLVIVTSRAQLAGLAAKQGAHLLTLDVPTWDDARDAMRKRLGDERV